MVAISLYRGNLHRVPDVPRRWLMPNHKITLKDFKSLLHKREKTLSRLRSTITTTTTTTATATTSNPNPNPNSNAEQQQQQQPSEFVGDNDCSKQNNTLITIEPPQLKTQASDYVANGNKLKTEKLDGDAKDRSGGLDGDTRVETQLKGAGDSPPVPDPKSAVLQNVSEVKDAGGGAGALEVVKEEKQLILAARTVEINNNLESPSDREKKKKDLEQNLKVLNERKHNLVQMLKQILTAEEEIKRRNNIHIRPPIPQQVETTTDLASNPRQIVNKTTPEAAAMSAPPGYATATNLPPLSVSGTHYTASSPSPAGSGGTSVFRDSRITSPSWN